MQRGNVAECHASVLAPEETEEELDFQVLRYPNASYHYASNTFLWQKLKPVCLFFFSREVQDYKEAKDTLEMRVDQ